MKSHFERIAWCARWPAVTVWLILAVVGVRADEIDVAGEHLVQIKIVGYEDGWIEYRDAGGVFDQLEVWRVDRLSVGGHPFAKELNDAEELTAAGQSGQALEHYGRAVRGANGFWAGLIQARLLRAADQAAQLEKMVRAFLDCLERQPVTAAHLFPSSLPEQPSRSVNRALKRIKRFESQQSEGDRKLLARMLRYALLRAVSDPEWTDLNRQIAKTVIQSKLVTERTGAVQIAAMETLLAGGAAHEVIGDVRRSLSTAPDDYVPPLLLLLGEALLASAQSPDDCLGAAIPAMRVAIHFPQTRYAGEGLLLAARAHEASGRKSDAVRILREVIRRDATMEQDKQIARKELARLSADKRSRS